MCYNFTENKVVFYSWPKFFLRLTSHWKILNDFTKSILYQNRALSSGFFTWKHIYNLRVLYVSQVYVLCLFLYLGWIFSKKNKNKTNKNNSPNQKRQGILISIRYFTSFDNRTFLGAMTTWQPFIRWTVE
jgi:hypothetical protein